MNLTEFRKYLTDQDRSPNTINAYCKDIDQYIRWFEHENKQDFHPPLLNAPDLREYRRHLLEEDQVKATTWNRHRASLKVFAMWAAQKGWVQGDPLNSVNPVAIEDPLPKALSPEEFRRLRRQMEIEVNSARTETWRKQALRDRAMMSLMLYCGLRSGEVVKLDVSDLLLRDKSGEARVRQGKGRKDATVKVPSEARLALRQWLAVHPGGHSLFPGKDTERISQRQIERRVKALGAASGLDDVWPHRARHWMITRALNELGLPLPVVQKMARHKRGDTTMRYAAATDQQVAAAAEML
jgi:site-specific recombinase XerD